MDDRPVGALVPLPARAVVQLVTARVVADREVLDSFAALDRLGDALLDNPATLGDSQAQRCSVDLDPSRDSDTGDHDAASCRRDGAVRGRDLAARRCLRACCLICRTRSPGRPK